MIILFNLLLGIALSINREQLSAPTMILLNGLFGKSFNRINVQLEIGIARQNITEKIGDNDPDWVNFNGWNSGIIINYPIKIGKETTYYSYGLPGVVSHQINLHLGLRSLFLDEKEATGGMIELGIGYRFSAYKVKAFEYKEGYLNEK